MIRIADVRVGDLVWTHLQRWRRVCDVSCQEADTVVIKGHGHPGLITTAEHPFEAYDVPRPGFGRLPNPVNSDWVKASNMVEKWWSSPATFPVTEALTEENYRIGYEGLGPQTKRIEISSALMNFVGQWLGNGCVGHGKHNKSTITLCGHMRKKEHMLAISTSAGLRPSIIPGMTKKNVCVIQCYSGALARWLTHHFGAYAYGKTLPAWVFFMPEEYRRQLLLGYQFADGHQQYEHLNDSKTVSRNLGFALKILAQTLSLHTTMSHKDASEQFFRSTNKISKTREQWRLRTITKYKRWGGGKYWDGRYMGRVKSVIPGEKQLVYNLSVDEDESYVADGVIVRSGVGRQMICESFTLFSGPRIGTSWTYANPIENDTHWMSPYRIGCLPSMPCESYKTEKNVAAEASQPAEMPLAVLYSSLGIKDSGNGINISCVAGTIGRDWWSLSHVSLSRRN